MAAAAAVLGLAAALFFARLGDRSLWSEEVRWAEIPREMQRSGDYFWPTFNGRVYYDKPLGSYWLVLAAAHLTGVIDELAARLPSAGSALAAVVFLILLARRLYGRRTAAVAGAVLATSFGFTVFARTASADAETVAGVLAALWLYVRNERRAGGGWVVGFWLVMALTSLTKGLLGFALPLLVAGADATWAGLADAGSHDGRLRRVIAANGWLLNRATLLAAPLAAAVYLAPFLLSAGGLTAGLGMVYRENVRRFFDPANHRGPVYLYTYIILALLAPWSLFLPAALARAHVTRPASNRLRRGDRFARAFFWAVFLFFTASASRRSYYLLPVLPAAALLVAAVLTRRADRLPEAARRLRTAGVGLIALAVLAAPVALVPPDLRPAPLGRLPELPAPAAFVAAWAVAVGALAIAAVRPRRLAAALVAAAFAGQAYLFVFALPATEPYRTQRAFVAAVRNRFGDELSAGLALYRTDEIVYYLDPPGPLPEFDTPDELRRAANDGGIRWLILRRRDRAALGDGWADVVAEPVGPWDTDDRAGTKLLLVRATGRE
jgi:4-amino-4-deoxy-L-arabinose transferase-like glycosyltransferase